MPFWKRIPLFVLILAVVFPVIASAQGPTPPQKQFGFAIGDDYQLINYTRLLAYWKKLAKESDRMALVDIGRSAEGRPMVMAIISSPKNMKRLEAYKTIARRLALAQGLTDAEARRLAGEGKAVVWIDGGLHATEIVGSQALMELIWQMVSRSDAETLRILDEVILLACPVNPDGLELVADWYLREKDPLKRSMGGVPQPRLLYGHPAGDRGRQPGAVHRLAPAVPLQPPPVRAGRHRPLLPAVPRSLQLRLRSPRPARHRPARAGHARAFRRRGQARGHHAVRGRLFDMVERRSAQHRVFPQRHRHPDRDHRQSHAHGHPLHPRPGPAQGRLSLPDHAPEMALPLLDRLLHHRGQGHPRFRRPEARRDPVEPLRHGPQRDREGFARQLDLQAQGRGRRAGRRREGARRSRRGGRSGRSGRRARKRSGDEIL